MAGIKVTPGINFLSVKLTFDMESYCKASKNLRESRVALKAAKATADQSLIQLAKDNLKNAEELHAKERQKIQPELQTFKGSLKWKEIKLLLAQQCRLDDDHLEEKMLAEQLAASDLHPTLTAHNLFCFNSGFIELFKNSIDAMIEEYLIHGALNTMLDIDIALIIKKDGIVELYFSDNAGGISHDTEVAFAKKIDAKEYKSQRGVSKKRQDPDDPEMFYDMEDPNFYYFGGAGLGIPILCSLLLDGEVFDEHGKFTTLYAGVTGKTSIEIVFNPEKQGTITKLSSPIKPFLPFVEIKTRPLFVTSGVSALRAKREARMTNASKEDFSKQEVTPKLNFFPKPTKVEPEAKAKLPSQRPSKSSSRQTSKQASRRGSVDDSFGIFSSTCATISRTTSRASSRLDETISLPVVL